MTSKHIISKNLSCTFIISMYIHISQKYDYDTITIGIVKMLNEFVFERGMLVSEQKDLMSQVIV